MINKRKLSNEPIKGQLEGYLSYGRGPRPVPPAIYRVRILDILKVKPGSGFVTFQIDFQVVGEARLNDGRVTEEYDSFSISSQWVTSAPRGDGQSMASDLLRSAGIATQPRSDGEMEEAIRQIQELKRSFRYQIPFIRVTKTR